MAVVLLGTDDAATADILAHTVAALGHTPLSLSGTENIVEDVVLNGVPLVLLAPGLRPFSGWDACEILRSDPTVPKELSIVLLTDGRVNMRRVETCGFSGILDPQSAAAELSEAIIGHLGDRAAPDDLNPLAELELD